MAKRQVAKRLESSSKNVLDRVSVRDYSEVGHGGANVTSEALERRQTAEERR